MATILLIDDDDAVVRSLAQALRERGHSCVEASSADEGIAAAEHPVDLVVVDVLLPDRDGVELARVLKSRAPVDSFLPVVVLTGADQAAERTRAFEAGCDDFLCKPVTVHELDVRVRSLLARRRQQAELAAANARLREAQKKQQDLAALVVHDLRNPLSAIQGNIELLMEEFEESGGGSEFALEALADCHKLAGRALFLVAGLLDVEELAEGLLQASLQDVPVASVVRQATPHHDATVQMRGLRLEFRVDEALTGRMDPDLIARLVENLLDNSVRYAPRGGRVVVAAERDGDELVIRVGNDGPPVPLEERTRIFGRYYRLEARRAGARANRGLGLYFCKLAAEAHGGRIDVLETDELPACFELRLPQGERLDAVAR